MSDTNNEQIKKDDKNELKEKQSPNVANSEDLKSKQKSSKPQNSKKKKIILSVSIIAIVLIIGIVILLLSLKSCGSKKENIASLIVQTSVCDTLNEKKWVKNEFIFNEDDISQKTDTTPAKINIEVNEYVKHEYRIENLTNHAINYSIIIEDTHIENCDITFIVNSGEEKELESNISGQIDPNQKCTIVVFIKIANTDIAASFDSKFYFTLNI